MTAKMAHLYLKGLLIVVLSVVLSVCREPEIMSVSQEDDVALPCCNSTANDEKSCDRIKWLKFATSVNQMRDILVRPKTPQIQDAERVKWEADAKGRMCLFLSNVQKSDEGAYSCEIWRGWNRVCTRNFSLIVKECKSLPAVVAVNGKPVNLTCPVNTTSGLQTPKRFSWMMLKGDHPVPVNSERVELNETSLIIPSVDDIDHGWYRCSYMNGQTPRCFVIHVIAKVENGVVIPDNAVNVPVQATRETFTETLQNESSGAVAAAVASIIIAIAIIAALTGVLIYRRRRSQRNTLDVLRRPEGIPVDSTAGYEVVNVRLSQESTERVNSLYLDERLYTFHY